MRAIDNYNEIAEYTETRKIPAGAYEVKIMRAVPEPGVAPGTERYFAILFDISDGEFKNYYSERFAADKKAYSDNAKYKGVLKLWYPNGGQYDENSNRRMKTTLETIKRSNNLQIDFSKEWDGEQLKGCKVGLILRSEEYDYNGKHGFSAQPFKIISLEDLREGNFTLPEPKYLNGSAPSVGSNSASTIDVPIDDDLPF